MENEFRALSRKAGLEVRSYGPVARPVKKPAVQSVTGVIETSKSDPGNASRCARVVRSRGSIPNACPSLTPSSKVL